MSYNNTDKNVLLNIPGFLVLIFLLLLTSLYSETEKHTIVALF